MICEWGNPFIRLKNFPMTIGFGESNGGIGYNATVPSDPLMEVCLTRLPDGETNPLSARSRSSEAKFVAKIGVGLLPFISIGSVWQKRRPVATNFAAYRRQLTIETKLCRTEMLGNLTANYNGIPRSYYSRAMMASMLA